jgi:outer membrane protein OmpA-like peptidoglycan-associated protein
MFLPRRKGIFSGHARDNLIRLLSVISLLAALAIHSGCAGTPDRFYIPKGIPINAGTVLNPSFKVAGFVDIENAQANNDWVQIGAETHDWLANLNRWTDTAINLLKTELNKRGTVAMVNAPTVFELILCKNGESGIKGFLFADVKKGGCPLDTDRDGVPDFLDRCPRTPMDMPVNRLGCPLDTDGDGSPDYKDNCPGRPIEKKSPPKKANAPVTEKTSPRPEISVPKNCLTETSRFTVAGPVPPDTVIQWIKQQLKNNQMALSEATPNLFTFSATREQWKEIMPYLELELGKRGVRVIDGPPRILRLSITFVELFWTFHDVGCRLNLAVETGDDRLRNYKASTLSPELYVACDEAVSKAVSGMFMKERIIVDTDIDMVPDLRDECPETPEGVTVDKVGCPLDTDQDGVPDYRDKCTHTPESVVVNSDGCPLDTDVDGVLDYRDECAKTPEGVAVNREGCPLDTDEDGIPDYVDQCPNTEKGLAVNSKGCRTKPKNRYVLIPDLEGKVGKLEITSEKGSQVLDKAFEATGLNRSDEVPSTPQIMDEEEVRKIFKDALDAQPTPPVHFLLYFLTGTTDLTPKSMDQLPRVLGSIKDRKSVDLTVSGHTDRAGSKGYNRKLSLDRAKKVAEFLVSRGVNPQILEITSHGEGNPLVKTPDGTAKPRNRRVEVVVR